MWGIAHDPLEVAMQRSTQSENINIGRYRKLVGIAENDPARDEDRYQILLRLLAEEEQNSREH
jgi:hypothetical protein